MFIIYYTITKLLLKCYLISVVMQLNCSNFNWNWIKFLLLIWFDLRIWIDFGGGEKFIDPARWATWWCLDDVGDAGDAANLIIPNTSPTSNGVDTEEEKPTKISQKKKGKPNREAKNEINKIETARFDEISIKSYPISTLI